MLTRVNVSMCLCACAAGGRQRGDEVALGQGAGGHAAEAWQGTLVVPAQHSTAQGRAGQDRAGQGSAAAAGTYRMTCGGDRSAAQRRAVCGAVRCSAVRFGAVLSIHLFVRTAILSSASHLTFSSAHSERAFHSRAADRQIDAADSRPALKHQISHSLPIIPLSSRRTLAVPRACIVPSGRGPHWRQHRSRRAAPSTSQASRPGRGPAPSARSEFPRSGEA